MAFSNASFMMLLFLRKTAAKMTIIAASGELEWKTFHFLSVFTNIQLSEEQPLLLLVAIYYLCAMLVTVKHVCNSNLSEYHAKIMFAIVGVSADRKLLFLTEISNYHF